MAKKQAKPMQTATEEEATTGVGSMSPEARDLYEKRQFLAKVKRELQRDIDSRRRYDYEWMVREMFRRGYHFSRYTPTTQTIVLASRQNAKIPINITSAQMRSIRNQVTSFRPKFEVMPRYGTDESENQARYAGRYLDYWYDKNKIKTRIKETVIQGLTFSVGGPWEIYYDPELKEVKMYLLDPFDFYVDRFAESFPEAMRCVKAVRTNLGEVRANQDFDKDALKEVTSAQSKLAVSEYKQFIIQAVKILDQAGYDDAENVILYEGYYKLRNKDGKQFIRRVVWTDQNITPLLWEDLDDDSFPFVMYRADLNPKDIYGESWMKHVIPINRVIDQLESSVYDYNHRVAKGRIVVDRDSGVRAIHNVHGEIVTKNRGSEVKAMDMPALPVAVSLQIDRMNRYLEDVGGAHDASLGRVPAGVKAGVGIAELRQADATNQDDLVDNLEDFLEEVGIRVLKEVSRNVDTYEFVRAMGIREGEEKYFAVIGKGSSRNKNKKQVKIGSDWVDLAVIGDQNNIRVTIGSWLGYTKEMMQEKTMNLLKMGAIDQKTFLRLWEFGDIDKIINETRKEALLNKALNPNNQQQQNPGEADQYGLAMTENEMMVMEGKDMPVDPHDDHMVHIAVHQDALGQGADDLVGKHIEIHQQYASQQYGSTGSNSQPQQQGQGQPGQDNALQGQVGSQQPDQSGTGLNTGETPPIPTNPAIGRAPTANSPMGAIMQGQPVATGNPFGT